MLKSFQHPKAMGNARRGLRGLMFPVWFVTTVKAETSFGPEPGNPVAALPSLSHSVYTFVGRIEPVPAEEHLADDRIKSREAYRMYYLPLDAAGEDYQSATALAGALFSPPHVITLGSEGARPLKTSDLLYIGARVPGTPATGDKVNPTV